jgi:superfamily I DNA/RNA helicase
VLAGAGTGKTTAITAAVGHRIAVRGIPAQRILAATWVRGHRAHAEGSGAGNPL